MALSTNDRNEIRAIVREELATAAADATAAEAVEPEADSAEAGAPQAFGAINEDA